MLSVVYTDRGLARNPSLSELGTGVFALGATTAATARISVTAGPWAGFELRLTGADFQFVSGVPWSGALDGLTLHAPGSGQTLAFATRGGGGLGVDIASLWQALQTGGGLAAQALFQDAAAGDLDIAGSSGNDSIRDWRYGTGATLRRIDAGAGDDVIDAVHLPYANLENGLLYAGAGNDTIGTGVLGTVYGGDGDDLFQGNGGEATLEYRFDHGDAGNDTFDLPGGSGLIYTYGGAGDDRVNLNYSPYSFRLMGDLGVETWVIGATRPQITVFNAAPATYLARTPGQDLLLIGTAGDFRTLVAQDFAAVVLQFQPVSGGRLITTAAGDLVTAGEPSLRGLDLQTLEGDDSVTLGGFDLRVDLGAGNDVLTLPGHAPGSHFLGGAGDDRFTLQSLRFLEASFDGGEGLDALIVTDTANLLIDLADAATRARFAGVEGLQTAGGNDTLSGDAGDNRLAGGAGRNMLDGRDGQDSADYSAETGAIAVTLAGADLALLTVDGLARDALRNIEVILGGSGADSVQGDAADNALRGNGGDDRFFGGAGQDRFLLGLARAAVQVIDRRDLGYLLLRSAEGEDRIGADVETVVFADGAASFAELAAGAAGATITGTPAGEMLAGTGFSERILALAGNDWITPGTGSDTVYGGAGRDMVSFATLSDTPGRTAVQYRLDLDLGAGRATTSGADVYEVSEVERVTGTVFADRLRGSDGDDELRGLGDYDWFVATAGADTYDGGTGQDMVSYVGWAPGVPNEAIDPLATLGLPPAAVPGVLVDLSNPGRNTGLAAGHSLASIERITGSSWVDVFWGDGNENDFRGLGGYDWFVGSAGGRERYFGGDGLDTVTYALSGAGVTASLSNGAQVEGQETGFGTAGDAARDLYFGIENLAGSAFADRLEGSSGRNTLMGLAGDDFLFGGGGSDLLSGGAGNDRLDGGAGSDTAHFTGPRAAYTLTRTGPTLTLRGPDGSDTAVNIEYFRFEDQTLSLWEI